MVDRDEERVSRTEVQTLLNIDEAFLLELEREALVASDASGYYARATVERIRVCYALHDELGVNIAGLEVALNLIDRIHAERTQFHSVLAWLKTELSNL